MNISKLWNKLRLLGEIKSLGEIPIHQLRCWAYILLKNFNHFHKGVGQTILVYPGFLSNNSCTYFLRLFLKTLDYEVHGWPNGFNRGYCPEGFKRTEKDFLLKSDQAKDKVITIGYSHGGFDARELARMYPERIAMTITLGTPFADIGGTNIGWLYSLINRHGFENIEPEVLEKLPLPLQIPFISIYSDDDCVVKSHACRQTGISKAVYENIEVGGSHIGLPFNLATYRAITSKISGLKPAYSKVVMTQKAMAGGSSF